LKKIAKKPERRSQATKKAKKPKSEAMSRSSLGEPGARYPSPQEQGGRILRQMVKALRGMSFELPLTSHILCACSGGSDSVALAVLLAQYGRRILPPGRLSLLHVNHGWRGSESDADERFVRALGKKLGLPVIVHSMKEQAKRGESLEAHARQFRKSVFQAESARHENALVFTAHTADDQAETRIWRLFTGAFPELGQGILPRHQVEVRPLLAIRRKDLRSFLQEEGQRWREDSSNSDPRFLRAQMRKELMPVLERLFPQAVRSINSL
jgi:tRNA(Ile)-lysidine synthase